MTLPVEITEIAQGRDCDVDEQGERKYHRVFRVRYVHVSEGGPGQAILDQLTRRFDSYREPGGFADETALAIKASSAPEDAENSFNWLVTIYYSTRWWDEIQRGQTSGGTGLTGPRPGGSGGGEPDTNSPAHPLARPARYSWGFATYREVMEHDYDTKAPGGAGKMVKNAAGSRFIPPYETERHLLTLTVERNVRRFDQFNAEKYVDSVNDFPIRILGITYDPGVVRCESWTGESQPPENNVPYWTERIIFVFKKGKQIPNNATSDFSAWLVVLQNAGTKELSGGRLKPIIRSGHPDGEPWPLNSVGAALAAGYAATEVNYLTFVEFPPLPFEIFNLDGEAP